MTTHTLALYETAIVQGSGNNQYEVKRTGKDSYYCTCPSWKFIAGPVAERRCKHVMSLLNNHVMTPSASKKRERPEATSVNAKRTKKPTRPVPAIATATIECALAEKWTTEDPSGFYVSEKLDGMRAIWDGYVLRTRNGNEIFAPQALLAQLPNVALDGELFLGRGRFQECMSIVRSQNADEKAWKGVHFMVFDAPQIVAPFAIRLQVAKETLSKSKFAMLHEQAICTGHADLKQRLEAVLAKGGEGLMLRAPKAPYRGGRTTDLLKIKEFCDAEAIVIAHEAGTGRNKGRLGALVCQLYSGQTFKIGTGFKDWQRDHPPSVGTVVTFKYQEATNAGLPRFPVFVRARPKE